MKKILIGVTMIGILFLLATSGWAGMGETLVDTGEAAVLVPVNLVKFVGGTFKIVGDVLLMPFQILS